MTVFKIYDRDNEPRIIHGISALATVLNVTAEEATKAFWRKVSVIGGVEVITLRD